MKRSFFERYSRAILIAFGVLLPFVAWGTLCSLQSNANNVSEWLPANYPETREYAWYRSHFEGDSFVLASWEGCTLDDPRLEKLAAALVPPKDQPAPLGPRFFIRVQTGPEILERLMAAPANLSLDDAALRIEKLLIGSDHRQTCVLLDMDPELAKNQKNLRPAVDQIYTAGEQYCGIARADMKLGGPPVDNVAIDRAGERSLVRLASLAGVLGITISWWCLRSLKLTVFAFGVSLVAAGMSLALNWYSGGNMNAILLTMPPLVYVATMSGAIHLTNYYRESIREVGLAAAPGEAVRHAWLPLTLAAGTTAVGLVSLAFSDLVPIQGFGTFSALGVLASLGILFLVLPALFATFPLREKQGIPVGEREGQLTPLEQRKFARRHRRWRLAGWTVVRHWAWVGSACLAFMVLAGSGIYVLQTSVQLMRLFSPGALILKDYAWLEERLGPLVPMEVVLRIDLDQSKLTFLERMEMVEAVQERVRSLPDVGNALCAVTFAPPLKMLGEARKDGAMRFFVSRVRRDAYSRQLEKHRQEFIDGGYLSYERHDGKNEELWRISARVAALKDIDYGLFISDIRKEVDPVLEEAQAEGQQGLSVTYTGLIPLIYKAQRSLLDGLLIGMVIDMALIALAVMFAMREWSAGILLIVPSVFPVVVVFGAMGWLGVVVDIGTVMAPCVALGVTVDDVAHFLLWFKRGVERGLSQGQSVMLAYKGCAEAMYQSWGVIGLGLAVFAFSDFVPTQRFGYLMMSLLTVALCANLLLLPAMLASPLGGVFYRRLRKKRLLMERDGSILESKFQAEPVAQV